jgi:hypothetical protein
MPDPAPVMTATFPSSSAMGTVVPYLERPFKIDF